MCTRTRSVTLIVRNEYVASYVPALRLYTTHRCMIYWVITTAPIKYIQGRVYLHVINIFKCTDSVLHVMVSTHVKK